MSVMIGAARGYEIPTDLGVGPGKGGVCSGGTSLFAVEEVPPRL